MKIPYPIIFCILFCMITDIQSADIYRYIDSNGVMHFTDKPVSSDYSLYMKSNIQKKKVIRYDSKAYDIYIMEAADKYEIAFSLLKAVIKAESDFNPTAVSKKGAKGLMQIMPANFEHLNIYDPFNPRENIMGGTYYLKKLLNRFNGSVSLALAAYNAGPTPVEHYNNIPPYPETERYVKKVMDFYSAYKLM